MIIDTLEHLSFYTALNPLFPKVVEFLNHHDLNSMDDGRYELEGADLFLNLTTAGGKSPDEAQLETHNRMIDIQIPLSTAETYGYTPRQALPDAPYDDDRDLTLIPDIMAENFVICHPGMFAIFFPQDGHAPCIAMEPAIRKAIFKVKS